MGTRLVEFRSLERIKYLIFSFRNDDVIVWHCNRKVVLDNCDLCYFHRCPATHSYLGNFVVAPRGKIIRNYYIDFGVGRGFRL